MTLELFRSLAFFLTGGFLIFLAITVTRDNFASLLNRVTGAMLLTAGLGSVFMAIGAIVAQSVPDIATFKNSLLYRIHPIWEFFFPCLLIFSMLFPRDRLKEFGRSRLQLTIFMPQLVHLLLLVSFGYITSLFDVLKIDTVTGGIAELVLKPVLAVLGWIFYLVNWLRTQDAQVFGTVNLFYVLVAIYFLESSRAYLTNPRLKAQASVIIWGLRISLGLFAINSLGTLFFSRQFTETIQSILMITALLNGSLFFIFATIRFQFLDVRLVFRQSFVYTITTGILVGIYIFAVFQIRSSLVSIVGPGADVVGYVLILIMLLFFQPINSWLDHIIRSMFIRTRTDHRHVMSTFSRDVISQFDPEKLRGIIDDTLKTTMLVEKVYFILYDDEVKEYAVMAGDDVRRRIVIDREDEMLGAINHLDSPTFFHSLTDYVKESVLGEFLIDKKIRVILPMKDADRMLGFLALTGKVAGYRYSSEDINLLAVMSNQMVTALTNARLYVDSLDRLRLQEEVNMARQIQLGLLPTQAPVLACSVISAHSTPSRTVGGDFYDFIKIDEHRLGVVIADASGKGMPAALMVAQIQAIIRSEVKNGNPINLMLKNLNNQIEEFTDPEKFVTLFYGELNLNTGVFTYSNAGHNYPILVRADGQVETLKEGGIIIGALPNMEYSSTEVVLKSDDLLFLFTDGLSEAMNHEEVEYSETRLADFIRDNREKGPVTLINDVLDDVRAHDPTFPPRDDTTIIALKMKNGV